MTKSAARTGWAGVITALFGAGGLASVLGAGGLLYVQFVDVADRGEMTEMGQCTLINELVLADDPFGELEPAQRMQANRSLADEAARCLDEEILK